MFIWYQKKHYLKRFGLPQNLFLSSFISCLFLALCKISLCFWQSGFFNFIKIVVNRLFILI